jgi:hypothetical protein
MVTTLTATATQSKSSNSSQLKGIKAHCTVPGIKGVISENITAIPISTRRRIASRR